jgi:ATP-dependent Lhr-like helicase
VRRTPVTLVPRDQLDTWTALAAGTERPEPGPTAGEVLAVLTTRGAMFVQEIAKATRLPAASVEEGLGALLAAGRVTCDSFGGLRWLLLPGWRRRTAGVSSGRWSLLQAHGESAPPDASAPTPAEFVARRLLRRTGVVFRRTLARERIPVPWRDIARACRHLEARGEVRGGRFVGGFDGEQYALPEAVTLLRKIRRAGPRPLGSGPLSVSAADPLNFQGILTPDEKVPASPTLAVRVG